MTALPRVLPHGQRQQLAERRLVWAMQQERDHAHEMNDAGLRFARRVQEAALADLRALGCERRVRAILLSADPAWLGETPALDGKP